MRASRTASRALQRRPGGPPPYVCRRCLSRSFVSAASASAHTLAAAPAPAHPPPASGFAALASRRLISVSGPDAAKYLQGVVTANILGADKAPRRDGFYTAFLSAQGRVLFDVFVYPGLGVDGSAAGADGSGSFLIEVDAAEAERLARHIKRYKLRAKFDLRLLDAQEATVWQAWDDSRQTHAGVAAPPLNIHIENSSAAGSGGVRALLRDPRSPTIGTRLISTGAGPSKLSELLGLEPTPEASYRVRRYLHGVAEGQSEILFEQALPAESNMDVCGAVDFRKGCYVGQELTIRTRHRGVVRKRILPCMLYGEDRAEPPGALLEYLPSPLTQKQQDEESHEVAGAERTRTRTPPTADAIPRETSIGRVGKRGRSAGKWLAGTGNVGLALCRLEIMTDLAPPGEAASYSPGGEFVMVAAGLSAVEEGGEAADQAVKVKVFVPEWLRRGLAAQAEAATRGH